MRFARIVDGQGRTIIAVEGRDGLLYRCEGEDLLHPESVRPTNEPVQAGRFLPPINPRVLICIGASYRKHLQECKLTEQSDPVVFMKNPSAAAGHLDPIRIPSVCGDEVDYEGELAVVLSRDCLNVHPSETNDFIAGYTVANDVSARIWQFERGGGQWVRGKSFDTFAPLGPFLVTPDEVDDPNNLNIRTVLDGEPVQESSTNQMIRKIPELISFLSQDTTLAAGTVILTGTPEGVGWFRRPRKLLRPGSTVCVEIEKIGSLTNPVSRSPLRIPS